MLNTVLVKEIKWLEMGWNGVVSPNLSELVRAVRTVDELASFTPSIVGGGSPVIIKSAEIYSEITDGFAAGVHWSGVCVSAYAPFKTVGNNQPHNNLPPAKALYIWCRIA